MSTLSQRMREAVADAGLTQRELVAFRLLNGSLI